MPQPTPFSDMREHDPHRLSQRTGQMGDAGIDRDHQVQSLDQGSSFREIDQRRAMVEHATIPAEIFHIRSIQLFLQ